MNATGHPWTAVLYSCPTFSDKGFVAKSKDLKYNNKGSRKQKRIIEICKQFSRGISDFIFP